MELYETLGLTSQQYDLLKIIYRLEAEGGVVSPKRIRVEYKKETGRIIEPPNLFNSIKLMSVKGLIVRKRTADYSVQIKGVNKLLSEAKNNIQHKLDEFEKASKNTEAYFRDLSMQGSQPVVSYIDKNKLFGILPQLVKTSKEIFIVADFPRIAYSYKLGSLTGCGDYINQLWLQCFDKKTLNVKYLSDLDIDFLFNQAFQAFRDPKLAYMECETVLNQLETQLSEINLEIHFLSKLHSMDMIILAEKRPKYLLLYTKDEHEAISGAVYINAPQTAIQALESFHNEYNYADDLKEKGTNTFKGLRNELESKYKECKS